MVREQQDMPGPVWHRWAALVLLLSAVALLALALNQPGPAHADSLSDIRRVVVIQFDPAAGGVLNVDAVAARGMRMTAAITPMPATPASMACLLTGRLPNRHGVLDDGDVLDPRITTLPELLHEHGFVTGGFTTHPVAGFERGFDAWSGIDEAASFVGRHEHERFFLWVVGGDIGGISMVLRRIDVLPGRTLLIVTSTRGPGPGLRRDAIDVPMVLSCDGLLPIGESPALAASIDLAPTILDLLGAEPAQLQRLEPDGRSLVAAVLSSDPWPRRMIPIQASDRHPWRGVRSRDFSLQCRLDAETGSRLETRLYDLPADPAETRDAAAEHPEILRDMLQLQAAWFSR